MPVAGEVWSLDFRRLLAADLPLLHEWLGRDHVRRWWGDRGSYDETVAEYLPEIEGSDPTDLFAIVVGDRDVGLVQTYLVADYDDWAALIDVGEEVAGIDLFIAEPELLGLGLGPAVIERFVREVVFARGATRACVADPDLANLPSIRAFEKAGFTRVTEFRDPEDGQLHALVRLDRT